jgi:bifunctional non-homologous end joining protein LigD
VSNLAAILRPEESTEHLSPDRPDLFDAACNMGLKGMVSKRIDRPYRGGRSKDWIKVKNRKHPAMNREL